MNCFCFLRNVTDKMRDGFTAYESRFRKEFEGPLVIQDRFTHWLQSYAAPSKNTDDTAAAFQRFLGPKVKPEHVYTDGST